MLRLQHVYESGKHVRACHVMSNCPKDLELECIMQRRLHGTECSEGKDGPYMRETSMFTLLSSRKAIYSPSVYLAVAIDRERSTDVCLADSLHTCIRSKAQASNSDSSVDQVHMVECRR